jgi:predicted CoA-substrate-specific enzyme activase
VGLVLGVDIGAATAKALAMSNGQVLGYYIMATGASVAKASYTVREEVLRKAGGSQSDIECVVATGWGRDGVPFADRKASEITCHAKGAFWLIPEARSIIDVGGQDSKAISLDEKGNMLKFAMNDKCAAGTGRFFEVMAKVLEVELTEIGDIALKSEDPCVISSTCTVFAETEVVAHRAEGRRNSKNMKCYLGERQPAAEGGEQRV